FDKVARMLELPYPGGPQIDHLAAIGEETIDFPRAWLEEGSYDFSFSGLKSAVINKIHNAKQRGEELKKENIAASFQSSVVDVLTKKTSRAAKEYQVRQVIVAGGVAANKGLRSALEEEFNKLNIPLLIPPFTLCTDNAAMIAAAGTIAYEQGKRSGLDLNANPSLILEYSCLQQLSTGLCIKLLKGMVIRLIMWTIFVYSFKTTCGYCLQLC